MELNIPSPCLLLTVHLMLTAMVSRTASMKKNEEGVIENSSQSFPDLNCTFLYT